MSFYFLGSCAVCGYLFCPSYWLCPHCWKKLRKQYLPSSQTYRSENGFHHLRLIDWENHNFYLIKNLIESLKGKSSKKVMKELAKESFLRFIQQDILKNFKHPVLVPPPSRIPFSKDHAGLFATALSPSLAGEVRFILRPHLDRSAQKSKNRSQRAQKTFSSQENLKNHSVIFVDDVLTTGYTAQAVFRALGRPKNFLICTLVWRQPPDKVKP